MASNTSLAVKPERITLAGRPLGMDLNWKLGKRLRNEDMSVLRLAKKKVVVVISVYEGDFKICIAKKLR